MVDQLEERGEECWIWRRNTTLQILHVGENRITDAAVVGKLIPLGNNGTLVLTGNPCVPEMQDTPPKVEEGLPCWKLHL